MAIQKDRPLWPDGSTPAGAQVLFDDKFANGLGMWRDHLGGTTRHAPLSLTSLRSDPDSPYAMMLSVSPRGTSAVITCQAYRNISRDVDSGIVRFEAWMALGQPLNDSTDTVNTASSVFLAMDSQSWDNTHRGLPKLRWRIRTNPDTGSTIVNSWSVPADNGDEVYIARDGTPSINVVPALQPPSPGDNEFKLNFFRAALWYDLSTVPANSSDGKPGRYYRAEMGPNVYDLRGFVDSAGAPIGRGKTTPQTSSTVGGGSFAGGHNFSIALNGRTAANLNYPPILLVSRARATWWPQGVTV